MARSRKRAKAHLEIELSFIIDFETFVCLMFALPALGFAFTIRWLITDVVIPTVYACTNRVRIARILEAADGATGRRCFRSFKCHPISGAKGRHVRKELEREIKFRRAVKLVCGALRTIRKAIPFYSKERWQFKGLFGGFDVTISLDKTAGLGDRSGYAVEFEIELPLKALDGPLVAQALAVLDQLAEWLLGQHRQLKISYRRMSKATWDPSKIKGKPRRLQKIYRKLMKKIRKAHTLEELVKRHPGARMPEPIDTTPQDQDRTGSLAPPSELADTA
jgi:hypothetical protein